MQPSPDNTRPPDLPVLVTGATGFLGAYICRELLQKGYRVRAIRRQATLPFFMDPSDLQSVEWVNGDILDTGSLSEAMQGVGTVIHAAARVSLHGADREELNKTNVEGTANVVNMALENGVDRMVYISSVAALGRSRDEKVVDEESKWDDSVPQTAYAKSKFMAELEVWRGMAEGLSAVILNPSTILGYGDWNQSSCAIFKNVYREFPWYTSGVNGFVDVEDVARATRLLMESGINGERFIINGENWSFRQVFDTMADTFGKKRPHREATRLKASIAWRMEKIKSLFTRKRPLLTRESARVANSKTRFSNRKILQRMPGFSFTPLSESIAKACKKYLRDAEKADLAK